MSDDPILAVEEELRRAMLANDVASLDRLIDDDLVFTAIDGSIATKQMDLDAHRARLLRATRLDPVERIVRRYGDIAIVIARVEIEGTYAGAPATGSLRYTRIWHQTPNGWRIVAGHMSAITT